GVVVSVGFPFGIQVMLPGLDTWLALVATAVAVLFMAAHCAALVTALTTAVNDAPSLKSVPRLQFNVCDPGDPVTLQPKLDVVQLTPPPAGSGSLSVALFATPGPRLVTTIVNVAVAPSMIVAPSGVFTICSTGLVMVTGSSAHWLVTALLFASPL